MNICIIAHGNAGIGMGHVMRSLALAEAFRDKGHRIRFYSKYSQGAERIQCQGFKTVGVRTWGGSRNTDGFAYGEPEELSADVKDMAQYMQEMQDVIVVDSYNVSREFFLALKQYTRIVVYIDDLNTFPYPVDVIVNGTASAPYMEYEKSQNAKLLVGLKYNLLRREFYNLPKKEVSNEIKNILITTGNSDPFHMTEKFLRIFKNENEFCGMNFHAVIGSGFGREIWAQEDLVNSPLVHFYEKPDKMSEIMQRCDLAVSAGGSTLYELCACGVPAVVFDYAENQIPQILAMERDGLVGYIGNYRSVDKKEFIKTFRYLENRERQSLAGRLQSLVDGKGAERIAKELSRMLERGN